LNTSSTLSSISVVGDGAPVVLVPGMDGTGQLFYRQLPDLARAYRVATYALRDSAQDMREHVADLAAVVEAVARDTGRALVIGESFGGALAMSLAIMRPERVAALVVINSFPYFAPQLRLRMAIYGLRAMPWGMMTFVRRMTAFRLHSAHTHRLEMERFMALTAAATRTGYLNRLRALQSYDVRERLRDIRVPTLFLAADQDHLVPSVAQARFMVERVPAAALRVLEGYGHICLIAPGVNLAAILDEWRGSGSP
jgi:pimeloyl-ACP methyl ester carboxylesterase